MYSSPNPLPTNARTAVCTALNQLLVDAIDLYTQVKVAHWNIKGPQFPALHPLFDTIATDVATNVDEIAERVVTLGGLAVGTARFVAKNSKLKDYPQDLVRDLEHCKLLVEHIETFLGSARSARAVADEQDDQDTVDLLTATIQAFEKHTWFLRSTLEA